MRSADGWWWGCALGRCERCWATQHTPHHSTCSLWVALLVLLLPPRPTWYCVRPMRLLMRAHAWPCLATSCSSSWHSCSFTSGSAHGTDTCCSCIAASPAPGAAASSSALLGASPPLLAAAAAAASGRARPPRRCRCSRLLAAAVPLLLSSLTSCCDVAAPDAAARDLADARGCIAGACAGLMCCTHALTTTPGWRPVPSSSATAVQLLVPWRCTSSLQHAARQEGGQRRQCLTRGRERCANATVPLHSNSSRRGGYLTLTPAAAAPARPSP